MYHYVLMISDQRWIERSGFTSERVKGWLDGFAICASAGCIIHCLALPLVLAALPSLSGWIDPGEAFHLIVLTLAVPTSAFALIGGWRRYRTRVPLFTGLTGLLIMAGAIAFARNDLAETVITVMGSMLLASAHITNWRKRRCAESAVCPATRAVSATPQV